MTPIVWLVDKLLGSSGICTRARAFYYVIQGFWFLPPGPFAILVNKLHYCGSMQTQHKIEMDKRDGKFGPQPAMMVPPFQHMSRLDQQVPPSVGYGQQPYGYPPPPQNQGYPPSGYPPAAYPPPGYPRWSYHISCWCARKIVLEGVYVSKTIWSWQRRICELLGIVLFGSWRISFWTLMISIDLLIK